MATDHETLLNDWKQNAAKQEETNLRFLRSLKMVRDPDQIDDLARKFHHDAFSAIDCTRCANCCKTMKPALTEEHINRIAAKLGLARQALIAAYLEPGSENRGYVTKVAPCPFLGGDGRCTIYEIRPLSCREFPHTDKEGFNCRAYLHSANALSCPATYYIVKRMRQTLRRR
jgi:Fe-S-cluster containining protein